MSKKIFFIAAVTFAVTSGVTITGCSALLASRNTPDSIPARVFDIPTNELASVAWVESVRQINQAVNPTATAMPVDTALGAIIGLLSAAGGWYARHSASKPVDKTPTG